MRIRLLLLALALLAPSAVLAQSAVFVCVQLPSGIDRCAPVSATNPLPITSSGGGGGAVTIADGADVAEGAVADAASAAGGVGTVSAKLRLMTTQLGTINTTLGSPFQASGSIGNTAFIATAPIGITPTDRTVTSATGSSQTVMNANAARHSMTIVNTGNANCGVNPTGGTAVIGGAGTLTLFPGGAYTPRIPTLAAVTAICTAAQPLYADEN